jgi:signal transduction histidine kinase
LRWLGRLFVRLSFRVKFLVVGAVIAGPLCTLAGFVAAHYHDQVVVARDRAAMLERGVQARDLAIALALHRGLTASVLAGGEAASRRLVEQQQRVRQQLDLVLEGFAGNGWQALGPTDPAALRREVLALMELPDAGDPARNFERHKAVIDEVLAVVYRVGTRGAASNGRDAATLYDLAFVSLPLLVEDLGRQRGWGSAVLTQQAFTPEDLNRHLMYAGAVAQRLGFLRTDARAVARATQLLAAEPNAPKVEDALIEAEVAALRSIDRVLERSQVDGAAALHFSEMTIGIDRLSAVTERLTHKLLQSTQREIDRAEIGRGAALASLAILVLALTLIYREFERTTVQRLSLLETSSRRLARGDFDNTVRVEGSDEIAALAEALDAMRRRLREAVAENALTLATRESERSRADFLARWSHDLRTPLSAVLGFARLLGERDDGHLSGTQQSDLARIQTAGEHLLRLVDDVLDIARQEHHQLLLRSDDVDAVAVASDAVDLTLGEARRLGVQVRKPQPAGELPMVRADRTRLLQVLGNLVGNAIKFNRPHGWVEVSVASDEGRLRIDVADSGAGIAPDLLPRLFRPFERLDAEARGVAGTGLGLATARRLVEAMGGGIGVRSVPGEGACFSVWLPQSPATADAGRAGPPQTLSGRIAYVEDNETNAVLMRAMIEARSQADLKVFGSAEQALASREPFDLWIIDRHLPGTDGLELMAQLQARRGPIRAVMFSADALPEHRDQALAAGFLEHWTKPISVDALEAALRRLLSPR